MNAPITFSKKKSRKEYIEKINNELPVKFRIREWDIQKTYNSATFVAISQPGGGKGALCDNFMYYNMHRYPFARIISGNVNACKHWAKHIPSLFISDGYSEDLHRNKLFRQMRCLSQNYKEYVGNNLLTIFDDLSDNVSIYRNKFFARQFKIGSQHYNEAFWLCTQGCPDLPLPIKQNISYVILFKENEVNNRKRLFENFGGVFKTRALFDFFMDQLTGNFNVLVIDRRSQSSSIEECVYFYQIVDPKKLGPKGNGEWKFGAYEYKRHAEERFEPNSENILFESI